MFLCYVNWYHSQKLVVWVDTSSPYSCFSFTFPSTTLHYSSLSLLPSRSTTILVPTPSFPLSLNFVPANKDPMLLSHCGPVLMLSLPPLLAQFIAASLLPYVASFVVPHCTSISSERDCSSPHLLLIYHLLTIATSTDLKKKLSSSLSLFA